MAGRNLWHKPYFQPEVESVHKISSSKDRYLWERNYNHHLIRLQNIQTRPVYRPKIVKRSYQADELRKLEAEKAKHFKERTRLNMLPLDSRQASPVSSIYNTGIMGSPNISPQSSDVRSSSWPISEKDLYTNQNYPVMPRSTDVHKPSRTKQNKRSHQLEENVHLAYPSLDNVRQPDVSEDTLQKWLYDDADSHSKDIADIGLTPVQSILSYDYSHVFK